jgi:hypothetical protein
MPVPKKRTSFFDQAQNERLDVLERAQREREGYYQGAPSFYDRAQNERLNVLENAQRQRGGYFPKDGHYRHAEESRPSYPSKRKPR